MDAEVSSSMMVAIAALPFARRTMVILRCILNCLVKFAVCWIRKRWAAPRLITILSEGSSLLLPVNDSGSVRPAVYADGQLDSGPHAHSPAKLLFNFGQTPKGETGRNTPEHRTRPASQPTRRSGQQTMAAVERYESIRRPAEIEPATRSSCQAWQMMAHASCFL